MDDWGALASIRTCAVSDGTVCETPALVLVPFGKYVGKPLRMLLQDGDYCRWFMEQSELRSKYPNIVTAIRAGSATVKAPRTGKARVTVHDTHTRWHDKWIQAVKVCCSVGHGVSETVGGQRRASVWRAMKTLDRRCNCGNQHFVHPDDLQGRAP